MSIQIWIILILIGVASGMLSGFVGVGGGLIIVPALVLFLEFSQKMAQGTSLAILLLPVGILAVMEYYKHGYIDIRIALIISAGFVVGGFVGSRIALVLPQDIIKKVFAIFMLIVAMKMLFFDKKSQEKNSQDTNNTIEKKM
ncbi:MAG TPA: sulfite exporter TauE/SafE family protein [Ferruginibacter sp.]|nr:sulfite exporter TauE/SafE family protein [Ferruginibacter sp.]